MSFSTADLYLSLDDFSERILLPMMNNLAGDVASTIMSANALAGCNMNANLDQNGALLTPNDGTFLNAQATLALNSTPPGVMQKIINDPRTEARVVTSLAGLLNPASAISDQYYDGVMYRALGAMWYHDQTVIKPTTGTAIADTVNGAGQTGTSLVVNALSGTYNVGDIFTIANVNAVNMVTKQTTGELRQFVVTVAAAANGVALNFFPALIPSANGVAGGPSVQYQTVDSSPANNAAITPYLPASTTYRNNFRYSPQAITMATGDLPLPANKVTARHKYDNVSMRAVTDYMIGTDQEITRLDVLFGSLTIRPQWIVRIPDLI